MPLNVQSSSGEVFHLWQLPDDSAKEPVDEVEYCTLDNELSDGYRSTALFGSENGVRKWVLKFPTLAGIEVLPLTVTDPNGAELSREEYLRSVYAENKLGTPFAYTDPASGQYYLVDFEDKTLSMQRMKVKIYSTGLTLKQRRIPGVTIFDAGRISQIWGAYKGEGFPTDMGAPIGNAWQDQTDVDNLNNPKALAVFGTDVVPVTVNDQSILRFSGTTNDGVLLSGESLVAYDIFLLMKMREDDFSNNAGIVSSTGAVALLGSSGVSRFYDLGFGSDYTYRLNGVEYAEDDQVAPMNEWGIVHIRLTSGFSFTELQVGFDRMNAGSNAEMDLNYFILSKQLLPQMTVRLIMEALGIRKNLLNA